MIIARRVLGKQTNVVGNQHARTMQHAAGEDVERSKDNCTDAQSQVGYGRWTEASACAQPLSLWTQPRAQADATAPREGRAEVTSPRQAAEASFTAGAEDAKATAVAPSRAPSAATATVRPSAAAHVAAGGSSADGYHSKGCRCASLEAAGRGP